MCGLCWAVANGALVPWPIITQPQEVQKLTGSLIEQEYGTRGIGFCGALAAAAFRGNPCRTLVLVADPGWNRLAYMRAKDSNDVRSADTAFCYPTSGHESELNMPMGVAVNPAAVAGNTDELETYVSNGGDGDGRILRFRYSQVTRRISYLGVLFAAQSFNPTALSCTRVNSTTSLLAVADLKNSRLVLISIDSATGAASLRMSYGQRDTGVGGFRHPCGVCLVKTDQQNVFALYVSDRENSRVVRLVYDYTANQMDWDCSYQDTSGVFQPAGIAVNPSGYVYVADPARHVVAVLPQELDSVLYSRGGVGDSVQFLEPTCVNVLGDQVAVAECWSDSSGIQFFRIVPGLKNVTSRETLDVTSDDSLVIGLELEEAQGYVDIFLTHPGGGPVHIVDDTLLLPGRHYTFVWHGFYDDGELALPGGYVLTISARYRLDCTDPLMSWVQKQFCVKGTRAPAGISASTTWTAANEPYVLSGHSLDISDDATLTIEPGVRVMFAEDSFKRGMVVHIYCRIEADGTELNPIRFMPHRKMAEVYNPAKRGLWGEIDFNYHNYGAIFNHCVFENGGGVGWDSAVVYASAPDLGSTLDFDNCLFLGSGGGALGVETDGARDRVDLDTCRFEYCADYPMFKVKAQNVADLCATCTFANNDVPGLMVNAAVGNDERIQSSCTWPCMSPGWHYDLDGDLQVWSNTGEYPVFTIGAGAAIRMPTNGEIRVGHHDGAYDDQGAIVANGLPGAPVTFEGLNGDTWDGLHLEWDPNDSSSFRYCTFKEGTGQSRMSQDGMDYFPMLYCQTSPPVYRCKFVDAFQAAGEDRGAGFGTEGKSSHVSQCKFIRNEVGIVADYSEVNCCTTYNCLIDSGDIGFLVLDLSSSSQPYLHNSNVFANSSYGVDNLDNAASVNARHNWWGPNGTGSDRGRPGWQGNNGVSDYVIADTWDTAAFTVWSMDAQAVSILEPTGWHVPGSVVPQAVVRNYLDTTVTFTAKLGIGTVYLQSVEETLAACAVDTVVFPQAVLDSGWYNLGLAVDLMGDEDPSNDSVADTVWVRDSIDAAAIAVLAPPSQITVDDTIEPRVSIANYGTITRQIPVAFYLDAVYQATESVLVAACETAEVAFDARTFPPDSHEVRFICSLPLDDDRSNDTVSASVCVKPGDYWVAEDSPPYVDARLCWDRGQYVYAAQRNGAGVRRYGTLTNGWSSVASPGVETVSGITTLGNSGDTIKDY
jgi:hypothetical protein